jgi:hypothetical protein
MISRFLYADRYTPRWGTGKQHQPLIMASKIPALPPVDFPHFLISNLEGRLLPLVNKGQKEVKLGCLPVGPGPDAEDRLFDSVVEQCWEASLKLGWGNAALSSDPVLARDQALEFFKVGGLQMVHASLPGSWARALVRQSALTARAQEAEADPVAAGADGDAPLTEDQLDRMHGMACWWGMLLVHLNLTSQSDIASFWAEPSCVGAFTRVGDSGAVLLHNPATGLVLFRSQA